MSKRKLEGAESSRAGRARLAELAGLHAVPDTALAAIVSRLLPGETLSSRRVSEAAVNVFNTRTRHGKLGVEVQLPLDNGSRRPWAVLPPQALLAHMSENSEKMAEVLRSMRQPSYRHPWGILVYFDEATPGNPLDAAAKRRKFWNILWTFEDMPRWARHHSRSWFLFGILRSQDMTDIPGGLATVFAVVVETFVQGPVSFTDAGVPLCLGGHDRRVYATIRRTPADGGALQQLYGRMGANGLKPCVLCRNCTRRGSPALEHDPTARSIACTDFSQFTLNGDADLARIQDILAALARRGISRNELKAHETAFGFHFYQHSWLQSPSLRRYIQPASMVRYDAMHVFFAD